MRFLIIGAGGIGCYYGARLQLQGHSVSYLARGNHLQAMQTTGLKVSHDELQFHEKVDAVAIDTLQQQYRCNDFDMILLTLKAGATESILEQLSGWLKNQNIPMLSLQNGVDNEPLIAQALGRHRTLGGLAVRIGGHITGPGQVQAKGPAQVIMGSWPNHQSERIFSPDALQVFADTFNEAGIPTLIAPDIRRELWRKLLINNGVNPLSALTRLDTRNLTSHPIFGKTVYRMMQEVAAVAPADDVQLSRHDIDEMFELISTFDAIKTSMLVDKEKGRPLELEGISGAVLNRAKQLKIDVPNTELVHSLLLLEEG
ncbi:ketopantoate reductase family protein [Amphritea sp. HPY]|uniref:ketopantoate reductase family protein n=1 Tax=Amphritea sp. HPY TaxID=3421652 RepID=UPI003D7DB250